jgi:excisionase family DNA binding protein
MSPAPMFLSMEDAAATIGVISRRMLSKLAAEGKIPVYRFGGRVAIKAEDLPAIIDSFRVAAS